MRQCGNLFAFGFLTGLLVLVGCGHQEPFGEVSGTVKLDGQPVAEGQINFVDPNGKTQTAGSPIKDGQYTARKVPVGLMKVTISAPKVVEKIKREDYPDKPWRVVTEEIVPEKYNKQSELTFEVKPGKNEKDFDLQR